MITPPSFALALSTFAAALALGCGSSGEGEGGEGGSAGSAGSGGQGAASGSGGTAAGSSGGSGGSGTVVPIEGPNDAWAWVAFPGSQCAKGTPTGIGVNLTDRSDKVAIHFMGGGACWDELTCTIPTAVFLEGFPKEAFEAQSSLGDGMFSRDASNPFADHNLIFVPYCTGDVHAGSNPAGPGDNAFVGYDNFGMYLQSIVAKFPKASQVVVTGSSAGGFGTLVNFARIADAFPEADVVLLDDSGPAMAPEYLTPAFQKMTMQDAWSMDENLPAACPEVTVGTVHEIYGCLSKQYPGSRMGLVATLRDNVILSFYKMGNAGLDSAGLEEGTNHIADTLMTGLPNWRVFFLSGSGHTVLMNDLTTPVISGVVLADWIRALLENESSWANVRPN